MSPLDARPQRMTEEIRLTFLPPNVQALLRLACYGTGSFSLFCMLFPRLALKEMRRDPPAMESEDSKAERLAREMCRFFGFMFLWVSVMAHEIVHLPLEFTVATRRKVGLLLMWDALFVKFYSFHRSGLFKFNHSVGAGVIDFLAGLAFFLSSSFSPPTLVPWGARRSGGDRGGPRKLVYLYE